MDSQRPQVQTFVRADHSPVFFRVKEDGEIDDTDSFGSDRSIRSLPKNHLEIIRQCLETGRCVRNVRSENGTGFFRWDYFPIIQEECVHIYGTPSDTDIPAKSTYDSDHSLEQFIYHAPDAVIVYDRSSRILYSNQRVTTLLGYHTSELVGKSIKDILPTKFLEQNPLIHHLPNGEASQIHDIVLLQKNGRLVEVESNEKILSDNRYILMLRENVQHKRSRREFNEAIRSEIYQKLFIKLRLFKHGEGMIMNLHRLALFIENSNSLRKQHVFDRFVYASEEYKKIIYPELKSIGNMLIALNNGVENNINADLSLPTGTAIITHANRLMGLFRKMDNVIRRQDFSVWLQFMDQYKYYIVDSISDISCDISETSNVIDNHFVCCPTDIVKTVVGKYSIGTWRDTIRMTDRLDGQLAVMNISELGEVTEILIENAIDALTGYQSDHSEISPSIEIKLFQSGDKIHIEIEDNGPGVPNECHSLLFKEGFSTKGPGRGFGLSYAAQCIQKYGGEISYMPAPDSGARFVITLLRTYSN